MKKEIHPEYFTNAVVRCACGNEFKTGSTMKEVSTEVCAACHPFYTGQEKVMDTAGRVEKFKAKKAQAKSEVKKSKKDKRQARKTQKEE